MPLQRNPRRLLVTGAAGFIGSAFVRTRLRDEDWDGIIVSLDALTYAGHLSKLADVMDDPRHVFVHGSILDGALLDQLQETWAFDTVLHCAAETHVDRSILGPRSFTQTNVLGTQELLEWVRRHQTLHLHHVSTDEVFGSLGPTGTFSEESAYDPHSPYAASKAAADHLVRAYVTTYGISATITYASNNFGPHQHPEKLIPLMITRLCHREPLPIYGSGEQVRDWLFVEDHAHALWQGLLYGVSGESYCLSGGQESSNLELVHLLIELFHEQLPSSQRPSLDTLRGLIRHIADRPGHDFRYAMDSQKARASIGWSPMTSLHDGLRRTISWIVRTDQGPLLEAFDYRPFVGANHASC